MFTGYMAVIKLNLNPCSPGWYMLVGGRQSIKHELNIQYTKQGLLEEVIERM